MEGDSARSNVDLTGNVTFGPRDNGVSGWAALSIAGLVFLGFVLWLKSRKG